MSALHNRIESIWWQQEKPPCWLSWAEPLYATLNQRNLQKRAASTIAPPMPLISIGNITVGGSGKTPFVIWLSKQLQRAGRKPVILCRGDGGKLKRPELVELDSDAGIVGDEALMLKQQAGCPVIAARDRVAGSFLATRHGDIIILDDGFQYRHLGRNCDIVLVPAEGVGNGHQIPAGPLREPVSALDRADLIVRSGYGDSKPLNTKKQWRWQAHPGVINDVMELETETPDSFLAVTAIARPERFFTDLENLGLNLNDKLSYQDHHRFSRSDVKSMTSHGIDIIVTAKDAVKLKSLWPKDRPLWQMNQQVTAEPGLIEAILGRIPRKHY